jgi:hypothetical protein
MGQCLKNLEGHTRQILATSWSFDGTQSSRLREKKHDLLPLALEGFCDRV